jgi:hypothetical protein
MDSPASLRRSNDARVQRTLVATARPAVAVVVAVGAGFAIARVNPSRDAVVLGALGLTLLIPIAVRVAQRRFDPFEPTVVFAVAFGAMFVVRPVAMLAQDNFAYARPTQTIVVSQSFSEMTLLAAAGAIAFVGAYALPTGRRIAAGLRVPSATYDSGRAITGAVAVGLAGIMLTALFLISAGETIDVILSGRSARLTEAQRSSSSYLSHGPYLLVPSALILFALFRAHARRAALVFGALVAVVLLFLTVPIGSRMVLLPFLGGGLIYYYVSRNKRPNAAILCAVAVGALFASTLLLGTRAAGAENPNMVTVATSLLDHPEQVLRPLTNDADVEMAPAFAAALRIVPEEIRFMHGAATVGDLVTRPIPRQLWTAKPLSPREQLISRLWPSEY